MAVYEFSAKSGDGKIVKGDIDAKNEFDARVRLRAQQLTPIKVDSKKAGGGAESDIMKSLSFGGGISQKDLQVFTRQFAVLVGAGVPIVQSLEAMTKGARSPAMSKILTTVTTEVARGRRLADALGTQPKAFDRLYINLVRAGEESGALETILNRLADYIDTSVQLRGKVKSAMFYPVAVIIVAILVVTGIMIFVIPKMAAMFTQSGQKLPGLTLFVMACSNWVVHYYYVLFAIFFAIPMLLRMYYNTEDGRQVMDQTFLYLPVFGDLLKKSAIARFSRTLSTLLSSGVGIIDALEISASTAGNVVIEKALRTTKDAVSRGKTFAEPLRLIPYFPNMVTQMISIGEQTGNIDQMLSKVADFYEEEVNNATDALTSLLEPMLMVVLGGIIAVIVIAMYLPIFNMANTVT